MSPFSREKVYGGEICDNVFCATYDTISLEDLELRGMQAMWGRKVTDLGFGRFVQILHQAAEKHGAHVHYIDRFVPCVCDGRAAPA